MAPDLNLPGFCARPMTLSLEDGAIVAAIVEADEAHAGQPSSVDAAETMKQFGNTPGIDPARDTLIVESPNGDPVAYAIVRSFKEDPGPRVLRHMVKVHPNFHRQKVGTAVLDWSRARLDEMAPTAGSSDPPGTDVVVRTTIGFDQPGGLALMQSRGYTPVAYWADMERDLVDIPTASLPDGVELRPVTEDQLRTIWSAEVEAFRDHWGFVEQTEVDWDEWRTWRLNDFSLWTVAWHHDEVVGQIRSFINREENEQHGFERGWTENISTARQWRGMGIAGALICESLRGLADRGLKTARLGVHTDNPNGARQLYEKYGYETVATSTEFELAYSGQ